MTQAPNRKVILCVDDEAVGLSIRQMILETQGYRVFTAENGREALELFSSAPIDLVILDYLMPGMHGGHLAEQMKRHKPSVPILMLSAYVDLPSETLELVDASLTKGEPPAAVFEVIRDLLRNSRDTHKKSVA
jgi:CheY-like chemotaxis protein